LDLLIHNLTGQCSNTEKQKPSDVIAHVIHRQRIIASGVALSSCQTACFDEV